jgi:hypothetical protein
MRMAPVLTSTIVTVAALGVGVVPAAAAGPSFEREDIWFEEQNALLTAECGVPVTLAGEGHATNRYFDETGKPGIRYVRTVNVTLSVRAGDNEVTLRDVGGDVEVLFPDGTRVLSVVGQLPFWFTGVLKIDVDTGEVLQEPQRYTDASSVCAALTS